MNPLGAFMRNQNKMSLKSSVVVLIAGVAMVSALPAASQISKSGSGYLFRMKFVKGQTINYSMSVSSTVPGMAKPQVVNMPMSMTVTEVNGNVATVRYKMQSPVGMAKAQDFTVKMDNTGKLVSGNSPTMNGISATLPIKPVPVGGTWTNTTAVPAGPGGNMDVTNNYKFLGFKTVGGKQAANIQVTMSGKAPSMTIKGSGTMLLLATDGSIFATNLNMNTSLSMKGQKPMSMDMKVALNRK